MKKFYFIILFACILTYSNVSAIEPSDTLKHVKTTPVVCQVDLLDIIFQLVHIRLSSKCDTGYIPPGKLLLSMSPSAGYTLEGGLQASLTNNLSFYTGEQSITNLSVITSPMQYSQKDQLVIPLISNIWLPGNKYDLLGVYSFYKYPSFTYGLGGSTSYSKADWVDYSYIKLYQEILRHLGDHAFFGFGYNLDHHFNIQDNNTNTDFPLYNGNATHTTSSGLVTHLIYDSRTNLNNPKHEFYGSILYRVNTTLLGSDKNWQYLQLEARKYFQLSHNKVLAFWTWNEFTFGGPPPYYDLPSNGWDTYSNTGRGYIQGRFRGPDMLYGEAEFRFGILKNGLLGGVVFVNATSVSNWPDKKFTSIFPGEGVGLRVKFNKLSDVNLCIDYGIGAQNSHGFFFNLGEIF